MKRIILTSTGFTLALILFVCSSSNIDTSRLSKGKYNYVFTDSLGNKIIEGEMTVDTAASKFKGTFKSSKVMNADYPGISIMKSGEYQGGYNEISNMYGLNMNPKIADANIFVSAKWFDGKLKGTWTYSTMMGIRSKGNFEAVKK